MNEEITGCIDNDVSKFCKACNEKTCKGYKELKKKLETKGGDPHKT